MTKRIYIGLPDLEARKAQIGTLVSTIEHELSDQDLFRIASATDGYSCADLSALTKDVAMRPLREVSPANILSMDKSQLRPVNTADFQASMQIVPPSVSRATIQQYHTWHQ